MNRAELSSGHRCKFYDDLIRLVLVSVVVPLRDKIPEVLFLVVHVDPLVYLFELDHDLVFPRARCESSEGHRDHDLVGLWRLNGRDLELRIVDFNDELFPGGISTSDNDRLSPEIETPTDLDR